MDEILDEGLFDSNEEKDIGDYKLFKSFHSVVEAKEFAKFLRNNEVNYSAETSETIIDEAIVGTGLIPKVIIKISPEDFKRVNTLISNKLSEIDYSDIEEHYLNQLDEEELKEIIKEQDKWSIEDINIAKIILRARGVSISDEEVQELREKRLEEIKQGERGNRVWMALYFLGIVIGFFTSIIFIIAGIGMGYYYSYSKSVDPDGEKYYTYEPETRNYGMIILYGGVSILVVEIILLFIAF